MRKNEVGHPRWPLACAIISTVLVAVAAVWGRVIDAHAAYDPIVALTAVGTIGLVWYTFATRWTVDAQRLLAAEAAAHASRVVALALGAEMVVNAFRLDALLVLIGSAAQLPSTFRVVDVTFQALAGQIGTLPVDVSVAVIKVYGFFFNLDAGLQSNEADCRQINLPIRALSSDLPRLVLGVRLAVEDALIALSPVAGTTFNVPAVQEETKARWLRVPSDGP